MASAPVLPKSRVLLIDVSMQLVAELTLDKAMLQDVLSKKW